MTVELWALLGGAMLGLVHIAAASFSFKRQVGNSYTVGPRDDGLKPSGRAARFQRASDNFGETFTIFAVCVLLAHLTQATGLLSQLGVTLYLGGRLLYLPLYAAGIPWIRTFAWNAATLGIVLVGAQCVATAIAM